MSRSVVPFGVLLSQLGFHGTVSQLTLLPSFRGWSQPSSGRALETKALQPGTGMGFGCSPGRDVRVDLPVRLFSLLGKKKKCLMSTVTAVKPPGGSNIYSVYDFHVDIVICQFSRHWHQLFSFKMVVLDRTAGRVTGIRKRERDDMQQGSQIRFALLWWGHSFCTRDAYSTSWATGAPRTTLF